MYNFCNLLENDFCNDIVECILTFNVEASSKKKNKVLLFPPLTARGRYLIHKCAETASFSSLSVGLEPYRRVVVYKKNTHGRDNLTQPRSMSKRPDKQLYVPKHRRVQLGTNNDSKSEIRSKNIKIKKSKTKEVISNNSKYVVHTLYNITDDTEVKIETLKNIEHTATLSDDIRKVCNDSTNIKEKNSSSSDCVVTEINEASRNTMSVVTLNNEIHSNVNFATSASTENVYNCECTDKPIESQAKSSEPFKSTFEQRGDILAIDILNVSIQDLKHIYKKEENYPRQLQRPTAHDSNEPLTKNEEVARNLNIHKLKNFEKFGIDLASMIISDSVQIAKVQKIKDNAYMNSIKKFSQELASKIITKGLEKTEKHIARLRKPININPNPQCCLEITVDNFVNKAIENAIEILKAVRLYERKVESCNKKEIEVKKTADQSEMYMTHITHLTQTDGGKTDLIATIEEITDHNSENIYLTKENPTSESATEVKIQHSETSKAVIEPDAGVTGDTERHNASQDTISIPLSLVNSMKIDFNKHLRLEGKNVVDQTENQKEDTVSNEDLTSVSIKSEANEQIEKVSKSNNVPKNLHLVDSLSDASALKKTKSKNKSKKEKGESIGGSNASGNSDSPKMKQKPKKPVKLKKTRGKQNAKEQNGTEIDATKKQKPTETIDIPLVVGKVKEVDYENDNGNNDDWEKNFTEDGECINEDLLKELSSSTGIQEPVIEHAQVIDYLNFKPKDIDLDAGEFGHILEIFDFSSVLKTQDIFNALKSAGIKDYNITWVDDTHALAVFASQAAAHTALKQYVPILQMRQVINGARQSKLKARELKDVLLPYKKRPTTTAAVARNLVTGALGVKSSVTPEQRRKERTMLKEAREQKKKVQKSKKDIWENPD